MTQKTKVGLAVLVTALLVFGGQAAYSAITSGRGARFDEVAVATQTNATTTTDSTGWVALPDARVTLTVGQFQKNLVIARFTGESSCTGPADPATWCSVRLLLNGKPMNPDAGTDFAFDSSDNGSETQGSWEADAMERSGEASGGCDGSAKYTVRAEYRVSDPGVTFRLDDWHLTAESFLSTNFGCAG